MDNKELIIQEYLKTEQSEFELILNLDKVQEKTIKSDGVIYTPWNIVQRMIELVNPSIEESIIEPSCGHGAFIFGLLNFVQNKYMLTGEELLNWFITKVTAIDVSKNTIDDLKRMLQAYFMKKFSMNINIENVNNLFNEDSLLFENGIIYDVCIGNPPYIRSKNISESYLNFLKSKYVSCKTGNIDIYYAFIEKFSKVSNKLCFITPSSFITNVSASALRKLVTKDVTYLVDYKDKMVFKDARTYTCIFRIDKNSNNSIVQYSHDIEEEFKPVARNILFKEKIKNESGKIVLSSIATLADSSYLVKKENNGYFITRDNVKYPIEKDILVPYLKLTKQKNSDLSNIDYMIFPYKKDDKTIIDEATMMNKFPMAYKYLLTIKNMLLQRDKGKTEKYEAWYAYGRKQGLHNFTENKVISVPMMIGGECKPIELEVGYLIKEFGRLVFTSGFLIPKNEENQDLYNFALTDGFIDFAKNNGKAWSGKKEPYYALTVNLIKNINFEIV